jgi:hypothetical protein
MFLTTLIVQSSIARIVYIHLLHLHNMVIIYTFIFVHLSLHLHETEVRYHYIMAEIILTDRIALPIFTGINKLVFTYTRLSITYLYR